MKIVELIEKIGSLSGQKIELNSEALASVEIPDEQANAIFGGLLNIESAKNNPLLKSHFTATALNGVDAELLKGLEMLGIPAESLKDVKSSYEKIAKTFEKLKQKMDATKTQTDDTKLKSEIEKLHAEILRFKETTVDKAQYDSLQNEFGAYKSDSALRSILSSYNLSVDSNFVFPSIKEALSREVQKIGGKLVLGDNGFEVVQKDDPTMKLYHNSTPVETKDLLGKVLNESKLLKTEQQQTHQFQQQTRTNNVPESLLQGIDKTINQLSQQ